MGVHAIINNAMKNQLEREHSRMLEVIYSDMDHIKRKELVSASELIRLSSDGLRVFALGRKGLKADRKLYYNQLHFSIPECFVTARELGQMG